MILSGIVVDLRFFFGLVCPPSKRCFSFSLVLVPLLILERLSLLVFFPRRIGPSQARLCRRVLVGNLLPHFFSLRRRFLVRFLAFPSCAASLPSSSPLARSQVGRLKKLSLRDADLFFFFLLCCRPFHRRGTRGHQTAGPLKSGRYKFLSMSATLSLCACVTGLPSWMIAFPIEHLG